MLVCQSLCNTLVFQLNLRDHSVHKMSLLKISLLHIFKHFTIFIKSKVKLLIDEYIKKLNFLLMSILIVFLIELLQAFMWRDSSIKTGRAVILCYLFQLIGLIDYNHFKILLCLAFTSCRYIIRSITLDSNIINIYWWVSYWT